MNCNSNGIKNRSVQKRQAVHTWMLTAEADTIQPQPCHPTWKGPLPPFPENDVRWHRISVQVSRLLKSKLERHLRDPYRHSLCKSTSNSSHTLFWLLQKLTLSWLEPGHYPSLILYHVHHAQILTPFQLYKHIYIYRHGYLHKHRYHFRCQWLSLQDVCWVHLAQDCRFRPS